MEIDENDQNMLDKYFKPGRITQIIGENSSLKECFTSVFFAHKAFNSNKKIVFILSKLTMNKRYIYKIYEQKLSQAKTEKEKIRLIQNVENQFLFFEFLKYESMGNFLINELPILLDKEKDISTLVINNLNNFFSTSSYKLTHDRRKYLFQLVQLAQKYQLRVIYLNDFFYYCETKFLNKFNYNNDINKKNEEYLENKEENDDNYEGKNNEIEDFYTKEPINCDIFAEHCSHILIAENKRPKFTLGNNLEDDFIEQGIFKVIKSNYKPHQKYLVTINKNDFSYNIEQA